MDMANKGSGAEIRFAPRGGGNQLRGGSNERRGPSNQLGA